MQPLSNVSDAVLLETLHAIVGSHRRTTAEFVVHLGEVDARRLHLDKGFSSLFVYCTEELRLSEDEAYRRIEAARLGRRFPAVHALLETGALSLSVLCLLKPYLNEGNHRELFALVSGASVRQAKERLAARFPAPDVPSTIRKLPERRSLRMAPLVPAASESMPTKSGPNGTEPPQDTPPRVNAEPARDALRPAPPRVNAEPEYGAPLLAPQWRCAYVSEDGRRCDTRAFLEFDHETPRGCGGGPQADNLRVLCRAHNFRAAELVYGKEFVARAISESRAGPKRRPSG